MILKRLECELSICKIEDPSNIDLSRPFHFAARTDEECSLVCPTGEVPDGALARDDGWRAFRIDGALDFSLIGILARISGLLAEAGIGIFAISTYNTDYILTKTENFERALRVLAGDGYQIL